MNYTKVTRAFLEDNGFLVFTYAYTRVPADIPLFFSVPT